jgi:FKBP-type peptidyl-prolyl cis-trans isomerase
MKTFLQILIISILFNSCRPAKKTDSESQSNWSKNHSVDFNQELNEREQIQIRLFLEHNKSLKMNLTNTGLRYMIYQQGSGDSLAKSGQYVHTRLKVSLLDGRICYETPKKETENFVLDKSEKETGVHEALRYMKKGDRAKLILPSYLGHGLLGDRESIPPQSILYIDLELVEIK